MPESCSIVCIYVKQYQTLPIVNLVFDPLTMTCWFCLKNAKDLNYNSDILCDTGTGHTYKDNSIKSFEGKKWEIQDTLLNDVSHNYHFQGIIQLM